MKEGVYEENIDLDKNTWNVMIVGEGKGKSVISGGLNFVDGTPTFSTATFGKFCVLCFVFCVYVCLFSLISISIPCYFCDNIN